MGIYDRDYAKARPGVGGEHVRYWRGRRPADRFRPARFNTWLIWINAGVFIAMGLFQPLGQFLFEWGHFSTARGFARLEVWRLVTFQFLHADLLHIFFNMLGLYFFGPRVEEQLGTKRYAAFYLVCGIAGGLLYLVLNGLGYLGVNLPGALSVSTATPLIGASAGVFGVIMARAYIDPNMIVQLLIPPIPLRMKTLAYGWVGLASVNLFFGDILPFFGSNRGGDAAHLGGAIAGWFFVRNPHLLREFFDVLGNSRMAERPRNPARPARPSRPDRSSPADDAEIDRILDKVSKQGVQSLSRREKSALQRASRRE